MKAAPDVYIHIQNQLGKWQPMFGPYSYAVAENNAAFLNRANNNQIYAVAAPLEKTQYSPKQDLARG